ncbi:MAG TPA: cation diffusion facilitator family transporter [Clostridia bacterium]|nr:cation diffusion facilitator family transporter [Clostridia bacterium]HPZ53107.1 cation diffusion facilitator family transporter [Clostridia bacterium]
MIKLLIKKLIPDYQKTHLPDVRKKYGFLAGVLGIAINLILFSAKLFIGLAMHSIAIISDAFNNLTDTSSSLFAIIGAKLATKKPDKEHPFGHGRIEYIVSLIISALIFAVGFELARTSLAKIINPEKIVFNPALVVFLSFSILLKIWMFSYNRYMGKLINSKLLKTAATDSLNDVFATSAVIVSTLISYYLNINADGYIGMVVSLIIIKSGFDTAKEVIDILIGSPPSPELVTMIGDILSNVDGIYGFHDLVVHEYGPGNFIASVHVEVPDHLSVVKIHETIDLTEMKIHEDLGVDIVIHMDPISLNDEKTNKYKNIVNELVKNINPEFSIHDFRITDGENRVNLLFDLVVPFNMSSKEKTHVAEKINKEVKELDGRIRCFIRFDNPS